MKLVLCLIILLNVLDTVYAPPPLNQREAAARNVLIKAYFNQGFIYKDIVLQNLKEIVAAITEEQQSTGKCKSCKNY